QPSMSFNKLPRELRDIIYEYVFNSSPSDTPSSQIAAPLLTCRQIYFEARLLAFARIDWRIDGGELMVESTVSNVWGTGSTSKFSSDPTTPYFSMKSLMTKARLSKEQRMALCRITIANCWYECHVDTFQKRPPNDILWYVLHDL
ncbi:hypothetical protein DE146DRAFT_591833, partial [Phaeosphaeria sp. MPI-PUGE-AT-0046c]